MAPKKCEALLRTPRAPEARPLHLPGANPTQPGLTRPTECVTAARAGRRSRARTGHRDLTQHKYVRHQCAGRFAASTLATHIVVSG